MEELPWETTMSLQYSMASSSTTDDDERDVLYQEFVNAAHRGDLETVENRLFDAVVPIDCPDNRKHGSTALIAASYEGHVKIIQFLIALGANVNHANRRGVTALHAACGSLSHVAVVEELLKAGAQVDVKDKMGQTPLLRLLLVHGCSSDIPKQVEMAHLLLEAGCDVNVEDNNGVTPLLQVCGHDNDMGEMLCILFDAGARVTSAFHGRHVLHKCARDSMIHHVRIWLDLGIDIRERDKNGQTALHVAVQNNSWNVVRMLLQHVDDENCGDDFAQPDEERIRLIDFQDNKGRTALHYAILEQSLELVQELLDWKPNLQIESFDDHYFTPLHMEIRAIGYNQTRNRMDILRCLVEHPNGYGLDQINEFAFKGGTVLHLALERENYDLAVIEYLSKFIDIRIQGIEGNTVLHVAVKRYYAMIELLPLLLRSRYATEAVNVRNSSHGATILHDSIILRRDKDTVEAIARMANVNVTDGDGKTALHYAVALKPIYVSILLHQMPDLSIRDHHGNTAFVLACCSKTGRRKQKQKDQLSNIFALYRHGIAYGEVPNMV